jgi:threonine dehydrogenase-like Zn-dependent dehydrogenase
MGVVEEVGSEVRHVKAGDRVLAPFAISDGTCEFCRKGIHTSCVHGDFWAREMDGAQGEAVRTPIGVAEAGFSVMDLFFKNVSLRGGPAPVRAYMKELMEDVLDGTLDPSPVFDMEVGLDGVPDGYTAMNERRALKVMVTI